MLAFLLLCLRVYSILAHNIQPVAECIDDPSCAARNR